MHLPLTPSPTRIGCFLHAELLHGWGVSFSGLGRALGACYITVQKHRVRVFECEGGCTPTPHPDFANTPIAQNHYEGPRLGARGSVRTRVYASYRALKIACQFSGLVALCCPGPCRGLYENRRPGRVQ